MDREALLIRPDRALAARSFPIRFRVEDVLVHSARPRLTLDPERARRALNVAIALFGLLLALPVMLLVALAIKLTSRGPVIYKQTRVGIDRRNPFEPAGNSRRKVDYGGRLFTVYKFRTMTHDPAGGQVWASPDDPRVTRVGRVLRHYRLDELPQLYNVLRGDMNVVGPRPEQPEIFMKLRDQIQGYPRRQRVLPGITGWAQVNHPYDRSVEDVRHKLRYDLEYMNRVSAAEDLRIMLRTVPTVLTKKGAW